TMSATRTLNIDTGVPLTATPIITPSTAYTDDSLECNATLIDSLRTSLTAYYIWYKDDVINITGSVAVTNGTNVSLVLGSGNTSKNEEWRCEITPNDGLNNGTAVNSTAKTVSNSIPVIGSPSINDTTPETSDMLLCTNGSVSDIDGDSATWYYLWYDDGVLISGQTSNTLDLTLVNLDKGDVIKCSTIADDGTVNATAWTNSSDATIQNSAPTVTAPALDNIIPQTDDVLSCIGGTFSDNDIDSESVRYYRWYDTDVEISGQVSSTLSLSVSGLDKSDTVKCSVLVNDGIENSTWVNSSNTATIQNSAPAAPILSLPTNGSSTTDNTTTLIWGLITDVDGDAVTYAVEISDNSSFPYINQSNHTLSASNFTTAELQEGVYWWHVWAVTSDLNSSMSENGTFTVDLTKPTGISINAPSSVYVGDSISATCSASDNLDSSVSCGCNSPSTSSSGTVTVTCTATDDAGNYIQSSASVEVNSRPSSGGGGSSIVAPTFSQSQIWYLITPGVAKIMKITNEDIGFTEILIEVNNPANNVKITVTKLESKPVSVIHSVSGNVYRYLEVAKQNIENENINRAEIKFKVEKSWLDNNNLDKNTVALERYDNGWQKLKTNMVSEDFQFVYYNAETEGFSYFAVSAETPADDSVDTALAEGTDTVEDKPAETDAVADQTPSETSTTDDLAGQQAVGDEVIETKKSYGLYVILLFLIGSVASILYISNRSHKSQQRDLSVKKHLSKKHHK
ncbi:MAG: PGF-pre-PGF domain-containing protein, partial [Candidatus Aenigmarchaeota archaeon]|nr:PGF-pre-PGF domain-containing protein [Candidatus Aenigmarchaeota archaeon]